MKKKVLAALFVFVLIQFLLPVVSAAEPSSGNPTANGVSVTVNGNAVQWPDAVPFIDEHGRTMVPLRAVADAIGLTLISGLCCILRKVSPRLVRLLTATTFNFSDKAFWIW